MREIGFWLLLCLAGAAIFGFNPALEQISKCRHSQEECCEKCVGTTQKIVPLTESEIIEHRIRLGLE